MRARVLPAIIACAVCASTALAQSPNTAALLVFVVDQTGAVVPDAKVTVVNAGTGATREATSTSDGSATIAALPLTGSYTVTVAKSGFTTEEVRGVTLRAGDIDPGRMYQYQVRFDF